MKYAKTNPVGIDATIDMMQGKIHSWIQTNWGINIDAYPRCYKENNNSSEIEIVFYKGKKEYENLLVSEKNKFFFTIGNEIKKEQNYYRTTISIWFVVNVATLKPSINHRADEEVRKDALTAVSSALVDGVITEVTFGMDNLFSRMKPSKFNDKQPYHIFRIDVDTLYDINRITCNI